MDQEIEKRPQGADFEVDGAGRNLSTGTATRLVAGTAAFVLVDMLTLNRLDETQLAHQTEEMVEDCAAALDRPRLVFLTGTKRETPSSPLIFWRMRTLLEGFTKGGCPRCWRRANERLAEREGFEPSVDFKGLRRFSKPLLSTTQPPLREGCDRFLE